MAKSKPEAAVKDAQQKPATETITVNVAEFRRTRDALTTAWISLSASIDTAVKAYIAHTDRVMNGEAALDTSSLLRPFEAIASASASIATAGATTSAPAAPADSKEEKQKKKKRVKAVVDPRLGKRPVTGYLRYLNEVRPILMESGSKKPGEISIQATEQWKTMPEAERQQYKDQYDSEMLIYNAKKEQLKAEAAASGQLLDMDSDDGEVATTKGVPVVSAAAADDSDSDSDDTTSDDEPAPPPPPPAQKGKKQDAPKTPKSIKKTAIKDAPVPMFNSINPASSNVSKKRKSDAVVESSAKKSSKKKRAGDTDS